MPPPPLDLRKLEEMSLKKIKRQIEHLTTCKIPGLLNGFSSNKCNSANNSTAIEYNQLSKLLGCNTTVQWLNNNNNNNNSGTTDCEGRMCEVQVTLCYAGKPLPLRLMFTPRQPWMPPDLLLDDPSFMSVITLEMVRTKLPSLDSWAQGGDEALADLVNQLYKLYKQYQEAKLDSCSPQFYNQYNLFGSELHLSEDELEVLVTSSEQLLCVRLPVPFNELPPALFEEMRGEASCVLQLTSKGGDLCFTPFLHLSPRAEALLCGDEQRPFTLPPVPAGCSSLVEYTRSILVLVNDTIKTVHQAFETRKQIVAQLLCGYDAAISQYDKVRFSTIELLLEDDSDFNYLVDIVFPHGFPHRCGPRVQLRTISQGDGEEVVCAQVPNLPTVPANDPDAALKVILRAAMSFAPAFRRQRHSRLHT